MATDAEIVAWHRQEARHHSDAAKWKRDVVAPKYRRHADRDATLAKADAHDALAAHHARAADALEENARLRALLAEAQDQIGGSYCGNCDRLTDYSPGEAELSARIAAALAAPPKEG